MTMTCHAMMLQRAQSADMGQLGSGGEPMEVITEVDAWDKACAILESGCTPQQACALTWHLSPDPQACRKSFSCV